MALDWIVLLLSWYRGISAGWSCWLLGTPKSSTVQEHSPSDWTQLLDLCFYKLCLLLRKPKVSKCFPKYIGWGTKKQIQNSKNYVPMAETLKTYATLYTYWKESICFHVWLLSKLVPLHYFSSFWTSHQTKHSKKSFFRDIFECSQWRVWKFIFYKIRVSL